jgi:glycine betaine/choline ABC-type transport system substrate-binding protein
MAPDASSFGRAGAIGRGCRALRSLTALLFGMSTCLACAADALVVGSKRFTESYVLGEIVTQAARASGTPATHRPGMGNTAILFEALKAGSIDVYPHYTGTIARQLLGVETADLDTLNRGLQPLGLGVAVPLWFDNTYALALRGALATQAGIRTVTDLAAHRDLLRTGARVHGAQRRLAWGQAGLPPPAHATRPRPRAGLRRHRCRPGRRDGRLLHRRQDRPLRLACP